MAVEELKGHWGGEATVREEVEQRKVSSAIQCLQ